MNAILTAHVYKEHGFIPFPLSPFSKEPPKGSSLSTIDRRTFAKDDNIGLFPGGPNGLAVIDADNTASQDYVTKKLKELGLYDWTTIVRTPKRGGLHFWLRVYNKPSWVQTYYKLPSTVGGGEFRFRRPAYVVGPGSRISEGEYTFVQGNPRLFIGQPQLNYMDLSWCLPPHAMFEQMVVRKLGDSSLELGDARPVFQKNPPILKLLEFLRNPNTTEIPKVTQKGVVLSTKYGSRSEAEQALVFGLVRSGWDYDQVLDLFDEQQPGHYASVPDPDRYLVSTYTKALNLFLQLHGK